MERQIGRQIARLAVMVFPLLMIAGAAMAQLVVSTRAGIIQYIEGDVFLEAKLLRLPQGGYLQMENGQNLRTTQGRVELLLTPSIYLRMGENGSLRMEQNNLNDTLLALEQGSALIEVVEEIKGNRIRVDFSASVIEIRKAGLYRLDADSRELRVYGGEALVACGNGKTKVKVCRMIRLDGGLASSKFDADVADWLHKWAAQRSFDLFIASSDTRKQTHWTPISLGWLQNSSYRMRLYSQLFFDQWLIAQQSQKRAAAQPDQMPTGQEQAWKSPQEVQAEQVMARAVAAQAAVQAGAQQTPTPSPQPAK